VYQKVSWFILTEMEVGMWSAVVPICVHLATAGMCTMVAAPVAVAGVLGSLALAVSAIRRA
jgi:hypothetical protein